MKTSEVATYLGYSLANLILWRRNGKGPRFIKKNNGQIEYNPADLDDWLKSNKKNRMGNDNTLKPEVPR